MEDNEFTFKAKSISHLGLEREFKISEISEDMFVLNGETCIELLLDKSLWLTSESSETLSHLMEAHKREVLLSSRTFCRPRI